MKTVVVYSHSGKVVGTIPCDEDLKNARCMIADLPDGAVVESVSLENPRKPQVLSWYDPVDKAQRERDDLARDIAEKVRAGESIRDLINGMDLSNKEKWELEKEAKKYGI